MVSVWGIQDKQGLAAACAEDMVKAQATIRELRASVSLGEEGKKGVMAACAADLEAYGLTLLMPPPRE